MLVGGCYTKSINKINSFVHHFWVTYFSFLAISPSLEIILDFSTGGKRNRVHLD